MGGPPHENPVKKPVLKEDQQMLLLLHLSQLLNLVSPFILIALYFSSTFQYDWLLYLFTSLGGIVVPYSLWQTKKGKIQNMDTQGKEVFNFQLSLYVYTFAGGFMLLISIGFLILPLLFIIAIAFPIVYGLKAKNGKSIIKYPLTIPFIE